MTDEELDSFEVAAKKMIETSCGPFASFYNEDFAEVILKLIAELRRAKQRCAQRCLRFSKEKPTTPDFYWNRDGRLLRVGEILEISGTLFCHFAGESEPQLLELVGGEWARIPEPEESHDAAK